MFITNGKDPLVSETATDNPALDQVYKRYVGQWNRLVSVTNWEKGRIICQWRDALVADDQPAREYSDEMWAQRVGNISSQHVGRLRRVFERFGESYESYQGLYWSHFLAALDWDDAEMWLQGAVENRWSVSAMRKKRWETLGASPEETPAEKDIIATEFDEDADQPAAEIAEPDEEPEDEQLKASLESVEAEDDLPEEDDEAESTLLADTVASVRPFETLPELPEDLGDAFESFKLAILRHKLEGWQDVSQQAVLETLDALKELAIAPSE